MAGDAYKKVQVGRPLNIPAETFNAFIDAARAHKQSTVAFGQSPSGEFRQTGLVPVKNITGEERQRFDVVGVDDPVFTPDDSLDSFKNQIALDGAIPCEHRHLGRFAILQEPADANGIVPAAVAGVTIARVDVVDESHPFCDVVNCGTEALQSNPTGSAKLIWKEAGTGTKWAVIRFGETEATPSGSTTTTTTPDPTSTTVGPTTTTTPDVAPNLCSGTCRWIWSAASNTWSLDNDGCSGTTTTTPEPTTTGEPTTTTTGAPTSTTEDPCAVCATTTPDPSTTTTSTPTTLPPGACHCLYPNFCGEEDGDCTVTICSHEENDPPNDCTSTTTPDPGTTTTTCDCGTTTVDPDTEPGGECGDGCCWVAYATGGGWAWRLIENNCAASCPCPVPSEIPSGTCEEVTTACVKPVPPPPPPPPPCRCCGGCRWLNIDGTACGQSQGQVLYYLDGNCYGSEANCHCITPQFQPGVCGIISTGCSYPTTTTSEPTTTTTGGPCAHCTTTTSTTPAPCSGCRLRWNTSLEDWVVIESADNCSPCACLPPPFDGEDDCQIVDGTCGESTTTTTTTTPEPWCCIYLNGEGQQECASVQSVAACMELGPMVAIGQGKNCTSAGGQYRCCAEGVSLRTVRCCTIYSAFTDCSTSLTCSVCGQPGVVCPEDSCAARGGFLIENCNDCTTTTTSTTTTSTTTTTTTTADLCQIRTFTTTGVVTTGDFPWINPANAVIEGDHTNYATMEVDRNDDSDVQYFRAFGFGSHPHLPCFDETDDCGSPWQTLSVSSIKIRVDAYSEGPGGDDESYFDKANIYFLDEIDKQCGGGGTSAWRSSSPGSVAGEIAHGVWTNFEFPGPPGVPPWLSGTGQKWGSDDLVGVNSVLFGCALEVRGQDTYTIRVDEIGIELCATCT